ncbi:MAG: Txe/YoeB family addiction module toxin [Bacteroidales bacterium]|nr:Txe/YoeB family addiction module toxin [Bacteroidales bacterium]MBN2749581.1 Txe/YoeB family addiction module toxin [Bacteroidales bacterium]HPX05436.1 Txe/YoeB family addiction module toxin [Tenuifilaceae bacterium]HQB78578.1 Txe/YoeB family addiction module toxin [Tenuifilaceae bacterium]
MSYVLEFTKVALADIEKHRKVGDKAVLKKIATLLNEIKENPTEGTGRIELMKYGLAGKFSRRINHKHRLVYTIEEDIITVHVLSLWGHYEDK